MKFYLCPLVLLIARKVQWAMKGENNKLKEPPHYQSRDQTIHVLQHNITQVP